MNKTKMKFALAGGVIGLLVFGRTGAAIGAIAGWFGSPKIVQWLYK